MPLVLRNDANGCHHKVGRETFTFAEMAGRAGLYAVHDSRTIDFLSLGGGLVWYCTKHELVVPSAAWHRGRFREVFATLTLESRKPAKAELAE